MNVGVHFVCEKDYVCVGITCVYMILFWYNTCVGENIGLSQKLKSDIQMFNHCHVDCWQLVYTVIGHELNRVKNSSIFKIEDVAMKMRFYVQ